MRKQKIYIGRRRGVKRRIPWFMKKISMTFTESHDGSVSQFLDRWAELIINLPENSAVKERPTLPLGEMVSHIDFSSTYPKFID